MKRRRVIGAVILLLILALLLAIPAKVNSQGEGELTLRLSRDFGGSFGGGRIQGRFSYRASGPDNLERVEFYLDGDLLGEDSEEPFALQFQTDNFTPGRHEMVAVGYTSDGQTLTSNTIVRQFVTAEESGNTLIRYVLPVVVLAILVPVVLTYLSQRNKEPVPLGAERKYGAAGGAVCRNCDRPFPRHILSPNLIAGKLERCPHCGKWGVYAAASPQALAAALAAERQALKEQPTFKSDEERLRDQLDDSRYME